MGEVKNSYLNEKYTPKNQIPVDIPKNAKFVSYSQFSTYSKCPKYWKLCNIDRLRQREDTIHTVFGEAMHQTMQEWLKVVYLKTVKQSDELDLKGMLLENIKTCYTKSATKLGRNFVTKEELAEFYEHGCESLIWLRKNRKKWFIPRETDLYGIEVPIMWPAASMPIYLNGYLDVVLIDKQTGDITIFDLKTSKAGWTKYDKDDFIKTSQLVLYKLYFSKQYNVPLDKINVKFLVLKRIIDKESLYPQKYASEFAPPSGNITQNRLIKLFDNFLTNCFTTDGNYNLEGDFPALKGKNDFNCRFCEFNTREDICPSSERKPCNS